jgi:hypothetical protein
VTLRTRSARRVARARGGSSVNARRGCAEAPASCSCRSRLTAVAPRQAGISTGDLELPQVAVVGCQSSGKSSVLEALVRRGEPWAPAGRLGF